MHDAAHPTFTAKQRQQHPNEGLRVEPVGLQVATATTDVDAGRIEDVVVDPFALEEPM